MYLDDAINEIVILSHVLQSRIGRVFSRLLCLEETSNGIFVLVRWRGLVKAKDTLEPLASVAENVPQLFEKLLQRKSTPAYLVAKECAILDR